MSDKIKIVDASKGIQSGGLFVQINPTSLKITKKVSYDRIQAMGREEVITRYKHHEPSTISFEIYMDDTGAVPNKGNGTLTERIEQLEKAVYKKKDSIKEPGYIILVWGSIIFHGRLESIDFDYSLFASDGSPLRVKISLSFVGYFRESPQGSSSTVAQTANVVDFSSGDTLAGHCESIYNDASYCLEVAAQNNLKSIRNTLPGTTVFFSSLVRK